MKKLTALLCSAMCVATLGACSASETAATTETAEETVAAEVTETAETTEETTVEAASAIDGFSEWALSGGNAGAYSGQFLSGEENRPTDEELETILQTANTYFQCHSLTGAHFLVIKDTAEQQSIVPFFGNDNSGTVTILVLADGVKSQEYHDAEYHPGSTAENGGYPEYWNMYYGIYESGWASAYLNLAAIEAGYRTRAYAALNIENAMTGEVDPYGTGGNFEYITTENWDIEKYMQSADGSESFDHYVAALDDTIPLDGNVTLLCAIVIGKVDEVDTVTSTTMEASYKAGMRENYDFWDKDYVAGSEETDTVTAATEDSGEWEEAEVTAEAE